MPDIYPYAVPPGYQEGMSGSSLDPDTGERKYWALPPHVPNPPPQQPQDLNQDAVIEGLKSGNVDQALKQINAAQYFLGSRLLKQAQEKNDTNGMMRATMMMFPQHPQVGVNLYKSLVPPVARPVNALEQARIDEIKRRATTPSPKDVLARDKFEWMKAHPKANPEDYETIHYPGTKPIEGLPAVPGEVKSFLGIDALAKDKPAQPAIPGVPGTPSRTRKVLIAKPSTDASLVSDSPDGPPEAAPLAAPVVTKFKSADEVRAAYRSKSIDRDTAKKILSDQFNLK